MTKYLTVEEILYLHFRVIEDYGGSHGVRDEKRIRSVVNAPAQEVFGQEQYQDIWTKAAVYMRNIIGDHPFTDGNKRSGTTVCAVFLMRNSINLIATPKDLENFAVAVAVEHYDIPTIAAWLKAHSVKV